MVPITAEFHENHGTPEFRPLEPRVSVVEKKPMGGEGKFYQLVLR